MRVLLTGATGFVGGHLYPKLVSSGLTVRCTARNASKAKATWPEREWVQADVSRPEQLPPALEGCDAAFYLVHGMSEGEHDFRKREIATAEAFAAAAHSAGVKRIVYLGGFEPQDTPSEHLRSRLEVGEALRSGPVQTIELRSSMIVGVGSLSWLIVRDLAARLPFMVLPKWLNSRTQPVDIDDVMLALRRGLDLEVEGSQWFDLPGPDTLSAKEIMDTISELMGFGKPLAIQVPILSPYLSSHWVRFVTRADWSVAREVVVGLTADFLAKDARFWELIGNHRPMPFVDAARKALAAERNLPPPTGFWGAVERMRFGKRRPGYAA